MSIRAIARARSMLGARFRLHGRNSSGIDCVGLIGFAFKESGLPSGYALRTADAAIVASYLRDARFRKRRLLKPGSVLLLDAGPAQLHLGLWTGESLIHADANLRRVVETPGLPRWPILSIWRR